MPLGQFTLTIGGERQDGTAETKAKLHLRTQGVDTLIDADADEFKFPTQFADGRGVNVSLPYEIDLFTDTASGEGESTSIGYEGWVRTDQGRVDFQIAAQEAGSTVALTDLTDQVVVPISTAQQYVLEAETAATAAEAAQAAAEAAAASVPSEAELSATIAAQAVTLTDVVDKHILAPPTTGGIRRRWKTIVTDFQSGHGWTSSAPGTFNLNNTSDFAIGTQSASVVTDGTSSSVTRFSSPVLPGYDLTKKTIGVVIKCDNPTNLQELKLRVGDATNYKIMTAITGSSVRRLAAGEWALILFTFAQTTTTTGTPNLANVTDMRLFVRDTGTPLTFSVNRIGIIEQPVFPDGVISFSYDDSWSGQYTYARAHLDKYGWGGIAYAIIGNLDTPNRLTTAQLRQMHDVSGWDVSAHAYTQANHDTTFTGLSTAALRSELVGMKAFLRANRFRGQDHFAYPGGQWTQATEAEVKRYYASARTLAISPHETVPPANACRLGGYQVGSATSLATAQSIADYAKNNGNWTPFVFHQIVAASPTTFETLATTHQSIVDYVATLNVPVRTVSDIITALSTA